MGALLLITIITLLVFGLIGWAIADWESFIGTVAFGGLVWFVYFMFSNV